MTSKIVEQHIPCEVCGSSDAKCTYDDGHGFCYSCSTYFPANKEFILEDNSFSYEYLPTRGITRETLAYYDVKTKIDAEGKPIETGFRYPNGSYKIRTWGKKEFRTKDFDKSNTIGNSGLFGMDKFPAGSHKYLTITEGEYDALSLYQVLRSPVVSVQSAASVTRDLSAVRSWVNSFERVYLAFDNDQAGREAARNAAKLFDYNRVFQVKFSNRKDANEYLQHGEESELRNIWWNSKKYLPETIISSMAEFKNILEEAPKKGVPYPFPTLTDMTYGIRTGETVLVLAQEKVGKTALMHAIEHHILKETDDAVAGIFLEESKQRHLQALAGLELRRPVHLPDSGCSDDEIYAALERVVKKDDRLHVYSHFGSDDPEVLLDTIRFLVTSRACRYVLLDHITMAVSGLAGEDERRALDYLSTRLEMLVKELDFALIMVSHVNDEGKTRGSRYLTKVADITIRLERDPSAFDEVERHTTKLSIPYNRFCAKSGPAGELIFDPITYTLSEVADADAPQDYSRAA